MTAYAAPTRSLRQVGMSAHQSPHGRLHGHLETQAMPWGASRAQYGRVKEPIELSLAR